MEKQLPGGQIGGLTTRMEHAGETWTRTRSADHQDDRRLLRTALRWTEDGWYLVTSDEAYKATSREGPFRHVGDVESHLRSQAHGHAVNSPENPWDENHDPSESISTVIHEGLTHRLAAAARMWVDAIDEAGDMVARERGRHILDPRLAGVGYRTVEKGRRRMQEANAGYEEWLED